MNRFLSTVRHALAFTFITFTFIAQAEVSSDQVFTLMDKSGISRAIQNLPAQMQGMTQQMALTSADAKSHQEFETLFLSSLNTDELTAQVKSYIQASVSEEDLTEMLAWLNTDLAKKVIHAEVAATEPDFQQNIMRFLADMQSNPPSPERTQAVINFVQSSKMVEQSKSLVMNLVTNMFNAIKAAEPNNAELAQELENQMSMMEAGMDGALQQQMVLSSYYLYRDISDDELATYGEFYQQPLGSKYLQLLYGALGNAVNQWGVKLANAITAQEK